MPGTFNDPWLWLDDNGNAPVNRPAIPWQTYRVTREPATGGVMQVTALDPLPNVACEAIEERVGDQPATAMFRYVFGGIDPQGPQNSEQALSTLSTTAQFPHLVGEDDELAVAAIRPDGERVWLFDGLPLTFTMRIDRARESVTFTGIGLAKRCFDMPIQGAVVRENDDPETVHDVPTDTIVQFNPRGWPNATPGTADSGEEPYKYPVLMDPLFGGVVPNEDADGHDYPRPFDLSMAVAHLIYLNNPGGVWVKNPKRDDLDQLLVAREPKDGVPFDPNDETTYDAKPFAVSDAPLTDRAWPSVVHDLVKEFGFDVRYSLTSDNSGNPVTSFEVFLKQAGEPKPLLLQERGAAFDPALNNLGAAELGRDLSGVVNQWTVVGALDEYEVSFVLVPGFPSQAADAGTLSLYDTTDPAFATSAAYDAYRLWVLDESGEGHYDNLSTMKLTVATSLDDLFGAPDPDTNVAKYVKRRRPPVGELFSLDSNNKPLPFRVSVSTDYAGPKPAIWDGTGTWQHCHAGFHLLKDRIGVRATVKSANHIEIGKPTANGLPFPSGILKAVQSIAAPDAQNPAFFVRLTCRIKADQALKVTAARQDTSPIEAPIERTIDARDRYAKQVIRAKSELNNAGGATDTIVRDDTDAATAEAKASRTATEAGVMEGTATIPRFTAVYNCGDRISGINGRSLGFRTDTGGSGYAPVLPIVVAIRWQNTRDGQYTILTLSDQSVDRTRRSIARSQTRYHPVDSQTRAKSVSALATSIQKSGLGLDTSRL